MRHYTTWIALLAAAGLVGSLAAEPSAGAAAAPAPSGTVWKRFIVRSPATGKIERFWVGHGPDLKADGKHPVIYFLPGLLDHDATWKNALDPHLPRYDVVAVCPAVGGATWFMNSPAQPWMRWGDFLTEELRAFVESEFPVSRQKGQRGIAGISAGGHAAFYHAIQNPDLYGSVTVISGAVDLRGYAGVAGLDYWVGPRTGAAARLYSERSCMVLAGRHQGALPFDLSLDAGTKDGTLAQMESLRNVLDTKGIAYRWHVGVGGHDWTYWKSRASDHLAWHAEQFARNRRESRYTQEPPVRPVALEVLTAVPDVALSDEAVRRLRAPWADTRDLLPVKTGGLPAEGAPLSQADAKYKEAKFGADLTARGHGPGLWVYRLTLVASTPLPKAGTITLGGHIQNGQRLWMISLPAVELPVPAGEAERPVEFHARVAVELKEPDPLRGGIVLAFQRFDADGKPAGDPVLTKARPGTENVERWTVAPQARVVWTLTLAGKDALPLATIREARLATE